MESASEKTRKRRFTDLSTQISTDELCDLSKKKLKLDGNESGVKLVDKICNPESAYELLNINKKIKETKMTPEEALSLIIEANLTKKSYILLRKNALKHKCNIYPPYKKVSY